MQLFGTYDTVPHYQSMIENSPEKATQMYAMASNLRHAADETVQSEYRIRLLMVARDLEREAAKLDDHCRFAPTVPGASRAG
jgi:hypothetical protein